MKSLKIRLELNNKQKTFALQHCGVARHGWNWALNLCKIALENKEKLPSAIDLHKLLVKDVKSVNIWYYEVSKCSPQESLRNLQKAYSRFYSELKNGTLAKKKAKYIQSCKAKGREINYKHLNDISKPKFKKKGQNDSFYLEQNIKTEGNKIKVPKFGWLKCLEILPNCEIKSVIISRTADEWFISFKIPFEAKVTDKKFNTVGVDLGIKTLATLSDGLVFENPKPYRKFKRQLKLAQRQVSKKFVKGAENQSNNYKKASLKVAKIHQRIANIRKDNLHKITTYLTKNYSEIVIEDLNVSGMVKNHKLASAILDGGFSEFREQLEYKGKWYGSTITKVDRFYPSSKTCSCCGNIKNKLSLSERIYKCEVCNFNLDRDLNAAINLEKKAVSYTVCGVLQKIGYPIKHYEANSKQQVKST